MAYGPFVIKPLSWSKFLDPVHAVVSAIELSVCVFSQNTQYPRASRVSTIREKFHVPMPMSTRARRAQCKEAHVPGMEMSASSMPDILEKVFACIERR